MIARFRLRDRDRGLERLLNRLRGRASVRIAVGVLARAGAIENRESDLSVLAVAIVNEYGGGGVPARSFVRAWADENRAANAERIRRVARAVLRGGDEQRLLRELGREMAEDMRTRMRRGIAPPLSPDTAARKGSAVPLVGGQLERAIGSEVRATGGAT